MSRLLIVEDDDLLLDGLSAQLTNAGHVVTTAVDGALAQTLLESHRYDGVVLDLGCQKSAAWNCCGGFAGACRHSPC
jgi:two-component system, OmpR family, response regulator